VGFAIAGVFLVGFYIGTSASLTFGGFGFYIAKKKKKIEQL